jgi:Rnl2 family RNA ligase
MPFIPYHSIENHYFQKNIVYKKQEMPGLEDEHYLIQEKLHGTNLQIILDHDGTMQIASRNRVLEQGEAFFDVWETLVNYMAPIEILQDYGRQEKVDINLYCELFGAGIGKGVDYHEFKEIRLFDMMIDGKLQAPAEVVKLLTNLHISAFYAPVIAVVKQLNIALDIKVDILTRVAPFKKGNIMEGAVIKPYFKVYIDSNGTPFMLKKKNQKFLEKSTAKKEKKPLSTKVAILSDNFKSFITETRLQNIFSKWGEIERPQQMGDYIRFMLADAKEDWAKEHDKHILADLDKSEIKQVFNVGSTIANMLKKYL